MAVVVRDCEAKRTIVVVDTDKSITDMSQEEVTLFLEVFQYSDHIVKISDKDIKTITERELFEWCWENTESDCYVSFLVGEKGNIIGHFEQDTDAVAFKLRWL